MIRAYIDFDSTLYNTDIIREKINQVIVDGVCKNNSSCDKELVLKEVKEAEVNGINSVFARCKFFEEKYNLKKGSIKSDLENFLSDGEKLLFSDSILFLKRLAQKGFEINILTYTIQENFDYQMLKVMGANICRYVDNIILCTKPKGELKIDYENGYFFDDNPKELVSLFKAGVSPDRLFRIKRVGAGYSNLVINEFQPNEHVDFSDIEI